VSHAEDEKLLAGLTGKRDELRSGVDYSALAHYEPIDAATQVGSG